MYTVEFTAVNEHYIMKATVLVRDDDEFVNADAGYVGIQKRQEVASDERLAKAE